MRLYLRDQVIGFVRDLVELMAVLLERAREHAATVMPGYTHHQHAMVTTFGHLLLGFCEAFDRDIERLKHWFVLFNKNPLGSAAGYGTSVPVDREMTSRLLGFDGPTENTMDPITQRWEGESELAYGLAVTLDHLSTMAQTFILLSSSEFKMVRLNDRHCSGSSMMPQKRNPDTLEVVKAKTSYAHGVVLSLLSSGKALFAGYNRDTQWTKYWIMDLVDEAKPVISVMADVVRWMEVDEARMLEQARSDFVGATSLMEWMVCSWGLPLRTAKSVVERAVKYSEREGLADVSRTSLERSLREMKIDVSLEKVHVEKLQDPQAILTRYRSTGTPSEKVLQKEIASLRERWVGHRKWMRTKEKERERAKEMLSMMERE
jgi:argininosuccinate lyase